MQSKAKTVTEYLAELPEDRRTAISAVRSEFLSNLDEGFEEGMQYGMIGYYVPHARYPAGYHCDSSQPVPFAALASQKNYMSAYLMFLYMNPDADYAKKFFTEWRKTGKKLDMGKACIRFKKLEDLPIDVIGRAIGAMTVDEFIESYEKGIGSLKSKKSPAATARQKTVKKTSGKESNTKTPKKSASQTIKRRKVAKKKV